MARTIARTVAEGPGTRFAVWVQGCTIRCVGCFNPHLWAARGGMPARAADLAAEAVAAGVDGVTFLGGEPFEQAAGLADVARIVRAAGLSVMTFTGYELGSLLEAATDDAGVRGLLDATDLLVDGPYLADRPDRVRPWVGSTNQRFRFLSDRYRHLETDLGALPDRVEVRVAVDGEVSLNGWAGVDQLDSLLAGSTRSLPGRSHARTGGDGRGDRGVGGRAPEDV